MVTQREREVVTGAVFPQAPGESPRERRNLCSMVSREPRNSLTERKSYGKLS